MMSTSVKLMSVVVLASLLGCSSPPASPEPQREPPRPASVPVSVELYRMPKEQAENHDLVLRGDDAEAIEKLLKTKCLYRTKVDVAKGIPISRFVPQTSKVHQHEVEEMQASGLTHCWGPEHPSFLVPSVYHNKGFIAWYRVNRNSAGKIADVFSGLATCGAGQMLISVTSPGDQLIGVWSP